MRICIINGQLGPAFKHLGHEVLEIYPPPGILDVHAELNAIGFVPDLLIQTEVLGPRVILAGLESLKCPKVFWSVDTHLNAFWHVHYGRLFDAVATTQPCWVSKMQVSGLPYVFILPWFGVIAPFKQYSRRAYDVSFCGRIGPERPIRQRFLEFLEKYFNPKVEQN